MVSDNENSGSENEESENNFSEIDYNEDIECEPSEKKSSKPPKKGIIYLSSIPPYMNVTQIREYFDKFGKVDKIYLQLGNKDIKEKKGKKKIAKKFVEGWVEFERKHVAKKVARLLTNTRVSDKKRSKQYDHIWNIKYLKNFKWAHLHERLAYEKAARRQKLRTEIQLAKKKSLSFSSNLDKNKKKKEVSNREYEHLMQKANDSDRKLEKSDIKNSTKNRKEFLSSLF